MGDLEHDEFMYVRSHLPLLTPRLFVCRRGFPCCVCVFPLFHAFPNSIFVSVLGLFILLVNKAAEQLEDRTRDNGAELDENANDAALSAFTGGNGNKTKYVSCLPLCLPHCALNHDTHFSRKAANFSNGDVRILCVP